jgi:hypothetical protein
MNCCYKGCESCKFKKGDEIVCFSNCLHLYHKYCFIIFNNQRRISHSDENNVSNVGVSEEDGNKIAALFRVNNVCVICAKVSID